MYNQPKNTRKYDIVEVITQGKAHYIVNCYYTKKKYIFFGDLILKSIPIPLTMYHNAYRCSYHKIVKFTSVDDAEQAIADLNKNSDTVIKTIYK